MKPHRTKYVGFRDNESIVKLIDRVAHSQGIDRSNFIRLVVRKILAEMQFLSEDVVKAFKIIKESTYHEP